MPRRFVKSRLFWFGWVVGAVVTLALALSALGWLPYFQYGLAAIAQIPFTDPEILFAVLLALLAGFDLGAYLFLAHLHRSKCQPRSEGVLALVGTLFGLLVFGCTACNLGILAAFGGGAFFVALMPYLPFFKFVSFAFLALAAYLLVGKIQSSGCKI